MPGIHHLVSDPNELLLQRLPVVAVPDQAPRHPAQLPNEVRLPEHLLDEVTDRHEAHLLASKLWPPGQEVWSPHPIISVRSAVPLFIDCPIRIPLPVVVPEA